MIFVLYIHSIIYIMYSTNDKIILIKQCNITYIYTLLAHHIYIIISTSILPKGDIDLLAYDDTISV